MNGELSARALPVVLSGNHSERLAALFEAHYSRLYRLARRLVPNADDAVDLVQETFLKAARTAKSVPTGTTNEEAWLVRVLVNIRRDQWRKASVRDRHARSTGGAGNRSTPGQNPETVLIAKTIIWQALDRLAPRRRAIVIMYELEGLSIPAIASLLGISAITVRWHLSMGRRDLANALQPYGDTNEHH